MQDDGPGRNGRLLRELVDSSERRAVVNVLVRREEATAFDDLAVAVSTPEHGELSALRLYHIHLPKLNALDAIEWDRSADTVAVTRQGREALSAVRALDVGAADRQFADD